MPIQGKVYKMPVRLSHTFTHSAKKRRGQKFEGNGVAAAVETVLFIKQGGNIWMVFEAFGDRYKGDFMKFLEGVSLIMKYARCWLFSARQMPARTQLDCISGIRELRPLQLR